MKNKIIILLMIFLVPLLIMVCGEDSSTDPNFPEHGTISGKVIFEGSWPSSGNIFINVFKIWDFMDPEYTGIPSAYLTVSESQVTILSDTSSELDYTFSNIAFSTYNAIVASWLDPGDTNPQTNQHILGAYGGTDPTSVNISDTLYERTGINFTADFSLLP